MIPTVFTTSTDVTLTAADDDSEDNLFVTYWPYALIYVLVIYLGIALICLFYFDDKRKRSKGYEEIYLPNALDPDRTCLDICCAYTLAMFCCCCCGFCKFFDLTRKPILFATAAYRSILMGKCGSALLLVWRLIFVAVLTIINVYLYFLEQDGTMRRFGTWNNVLVSIYFASVTELSVSHVRPSCELCTCESASHTETHHRESSIIVEKFAALSLVLYAVVTTNSFFITVMKYLYYTPDLSQSGLIAHLLPSIALLGEAVLNGWPFRPEHYHYALGLPVLYLLYMWANQILQQLDASNATDDPNGASSSYHGFGLQYSFLQTDDSSCFINYAALLGLHVGCHAIAWCIHAFRDYMVGVEYTERHRVGPKYHEERHDDDDSDGEIDDAETARASTRSGYVAAHSDIYRGEGETVSGRRGGGRGGSSAPSAPRGPIDEEVAPRAPPSYLMDDDTTVTGVAIEMRGPTATAMPVTARPM